MHVSACSIFFFFFQAEDGIRDYKVTGVQTCALPICERPLGDRGRAPRRPAVGEELRLALDEAREIRGRPRDPVVGERGGAAQRDVAPAADPHRREGPRRRGWVLAGPPPAVYCPLQQRPPRPRGPLDLP